MTVAALFSILTAQLGRVYEGVEGNVKNLRREGEECARLGVTLSTAKSGPGSWRPSPRATVATGVVVCRGTLSFLRRGEAVSVASEAAAGSPERLTGE